MCSPKLSEALDPESARVLTAAEIEVAERCFFTAADPADGGDLACADWLIATVRFQEAACAGDVACLMPEPLARSLFDAFNRRHPLHAPPPIDQLFDLVGEFSNMICGAWLSKVANDQSFVLSRPLVRPVLDRGTLEIPDGARLTMRVNDLPLV